MRRSWGPGVGVGRGVTVKGPPREGRMAARWWVGEGEVEGGLEEVVVVGGVEDMVGDGERGCVEEVGGLRSRGCGEFAGESWLVWGNWRG